jgi:hypothetical protein
VSVTTATHNFETLLCSCRGAKVLLGEQVHVGHHNQSSLIHRQLQQQHHRDQHTYNELQSTTGLQPAQTPDRVAVFW